MTEVTSQPGVTELFGLNGKLFLAQLINLAVILFVVAKWVYKPLLKAIDARAHKIQKGLRDAEEAKRDRQNVNVEVRTLRLEAEAQARALVDAAREEAEAERKRLMHETKDELEKQLTDARARLRQEKDAMSAALKKELVDLVGLATEKVVLKTLDEKANRQLISAALAEVDKHA